MELTIRATETTGYGLSGLGKSHQEHLLATRRFDRHELSGAVQLALYAWQTPWFRKYCHVIPTATGTCIDYDEAFDISIWNYITGWFASGSGGRMDEWGELPARWSHEFLSHIMPLLSWSQVAPTCPESLTSSATHLQPNHSFSTHTFSCRPGLSQRSLDQLLLSRAAIGT
jgi:hypothetical protein